MKILLFVLLPFITLAQEVSLVDLPFDYLGITDDQVDLPGRASSPFALPAELENTVFHLVDNVLDQCVQLTKGRLPLVETSNRSSRELEEEITRQARGHCGIIVRTRLRMQAAAAARGKKRKGGSLKQAFLNRLKG